MFSVFAGGINAAATSFYVDIGSNIFRIHPSKVRHIHTHAHTRTHTQTQTHENTQTHTHTQTQTYVLTHTNTQTHTSSHSLFSRCL